MKKNIFAKTLCFCLYSFILLFALKAQSLNLSDVKEQMVRDWQRAKEYTNEYLNTTPADKYSFRATDSVRSFARQMLHLAAMNVLYAAVDTDQRPPFMGQIFASK